MAMFLATNGAITSSLSAMGLSDPSTFPKPIPRVPVLYRLRDWVVMLRMFEVALLADVV